MKHFLRCLPLFFFVPFFGKAQSGCAGGRYVDDVFSGSDVTSNIVYGWNYDLNNAVDSLEMDIYEPQGDTLSTRPLMVWAHGGSFVGGDKNQSDVVPMCQAYARKGYVTASINYRLGMPLFGPDSVDATQAVMRAVHDARASVRWFYKSAQNGNPYRIDTNRIIIAGVSAGGFISLHYAYLDEMSEYPSWVDSTQPGLGGGLSGNSGSPGYSEKVIGVINVCGAIGDTAWIDPGDEPLVSLHGTDDQTVPYATDMIYLVGVFPILVVDGSWSVHQHANNIGLDNCFYTYGGADHVPHVNNAAYTDTTLNVITNFVKGWVCSNLTSTCVQPVTATTDPASFAPGLAPNPATDEVRIMLPPSAEGRLSLTDLTGRTVWSTTLTKGQQSLLLQRQGLPAGIYLLQFETPNGVFTSKLIWE